MSVLLLQLDGKMPNLALMRLVVLPVIGPEINCGSYDHWSKAKRAVQSAATGMRLADALAKVPTVDVKLNATSFCQCPIENHNDIPEGPFCLVCGKPVR